MSCVYKITNITNNKIYIGSTVNLKKRKNNFGAFLSVLWLGISKR
jgi:predicted GIY-YIG superfamily endonuclease